MEVTETKELSVAYCFEQSAQALHRRDTDSAHHWRMLGEAIANCRWGAS